MKKITVILSFLLCTLAAKATHIVGGEIYYKLLNSSTNTYTITVNIYFDCFNGDPEAINTDKQIFISVWNAQTNSYIDDFTMNGSSPKRLNNVNYDCVKQPGNVCVDAYTYTTNRVINPGNTGVILAWQRCCRNNIIDNIINPESSGFTAWTVIPPKSTANSSAVFTNVPPVYICIDAPLTLQQPASDPDGDSLVYLLTTPYLGANRDAPRPAANNQYDRPPFSQLRWQNGYSRTSQLIGNPSLFLNPQTGELTITPTETGQFVVGFTVQEYRNGQLIGETRRDYQFNVIQCEFDILANFDVPNGTTVNGAYTFECGDSVCFRNKSTSRAPATTTYFWDLGDPTSTTDTLTTFSLSTPVCYVYPGNGNYTVTIVAKNNICVDDYKYDVRIRSSKSFELGPDFIYCKEFNHLLNTKTPDAVSVTWNTGQTGYRIAVQDTGLYIATVSYGKCSYSDSVRLLYDKVPPFELQKDSLFCDNVDITLDVGVPNLYYQWSTSPSDKSQTVNIIDTGTYSVIVRNLNCFAYDTIRLWTATPPLDIADQFFCNEFSFEADAGIIEEGVYTWSTGENTPSIVLTQEGKYWVTSKQRHCENSDTFTITNPKISLELGDDRHYCDSVNITLDAGPDGARYDWSTGEGSQLISVNNEGTYNVKVTDAYGCEKSDSVTIEVTSSPSFELGDDTTICVNSPTLLQGPLGYTYEWSTGAETPNIVTITEGPYTLKIIDSFGCFYTDSLYITVDPEALPNDLYVPNAFSPNDDGLNEFFPFSVPLYYPDYYVNVYSRWGEKVFDSRDDRDKQNWDGYYKGEKGEAGLYIYFIFYKGCDGDFRSYKGNVYSLH